MNETHFINLNLIEYLSEKTVIITGSNSGLGYELAKILNRHGAQVILACRDLKKGQQSLSRLQQQNKNEKLTLLQLDLSDLSSIQSFSDQFKSRYNSLDILVNNAGIMEPPEAKTKQGFELQFGVNHLGHFALTGYLLPHLIASKIPGWLQFQVWLHLMPNMTLPT